LHVLSSRWFKVVISLCLFALLLRSTDLPAFRERITGAQWGWMVPAFVGYLLSQVLSAYKWQVLARPLGFQQSFRTFVVYYFSGMYLNLFAPSTVAGDLGRSAFLAQGKAQLGLAVQSVLADRMSGLTMLLWVGALGVLFADAVPLPLRWRLGVVASALGMTAMWLLVPRALSRFFHRTNKMRRD
jgi:glycosyltransferase 2 family protein